MIIREGAKRSALRQVFEILLTIVLWAGYFFLMRHALSVVLSYFGFSASWGLQFDDVSVPPILSNMQIYAVVIVLNTAIFIGWAMYNKYMFGSRNRRRNTNPVTSEEIAGFFSLAPAAVDSYRAARRMVMVHDPSGKLIQCDSSEDGSGGTAPPQPENGNGAEKN